MAEEKEGEDTLMTPRAGSSTSSPEAEAIRPPEGGESSRMVNPIGTPTAVSPAPAAEEAAVTDESVAAAAGAGTARTAADVDEQSIRPPEGVESSRRVNLSGAPTAVTCSTAAEEALVTGERVAAAPVVVSARTVADEDEQSIGGACLLDPRVVAGIEMRKVVVGQELCQDDADRLFLMLFGKNVPDECLHRWTHQGIRFSPHPDTCMGLVQNEGGPCGVLAAIQGFVLKYLLFFPKELDKIIPTILELDFVQICICPGMQFEEGDFSTFTEDRRTRALLLSMVEILFLCGHNIRAGIAILHVPSHHPEDKCGDCLSSEMIDKALEGLSIESASDLKKHLRVSIYTSRISAYQRLAAELSVFRSRMGALLFLISALLSRGLEFIQADRDDPTEPLVTAPLGHASQEVVNLLLCGVAAPYVFDGQMDLGGSLPLKGIPGSVEVGFLTLLESFQYCKVGQFLKQPRWPIWVVGSETHYTVLFALDTTVQDESKLEDCKSKIKEAFDYQDQSGGGGFINVQSFYEVLRVTGINMPSEIAHSISYTGFVLWSEFWQALLEMDEGLGGVGSSGGLMAKKFDIYHLNGIAGPTSPRTQTAEGEAPPQYPRLCKLRLSVTPDWSEEEFTLNMMSSDLGDTSESSLLNKLDGLSQHAPLVHCIRTRWPRSTCSWDGDPPSIH